MKRTIVALAAACTALAGAPFPIGPAASASPATATPAAANPAAATPAALATAASATTTDPVRAAQWYLSALGITSAWRVTRGKGVTVCVIDSGVDSTVPDLTGQVSAAKRFTTYVNNEGVVTPHGTGVAAVVAGHGHGAGGASGVIGVAPQAKLISAVVDDDSDFAAQAGPAVRWCADNGAKVINMSFAVTADDGLGAALAYAQKKDVVLVAASGNTFENLPGEPLYFPAKLPNVIAVTGIDKNLQHDAGALTSTGGKYVSLAGPFSTTDGSSGYASAGIPAALDRAGVAQGKPYDLHAVGTSYASPVVAGVAALVRSANPRLSAAAVTRLLLSTATPAGGRVPNRTYGDGIVNAAKAVTAARPASARETASLTSGAPDASAGSGSAPSGSAQTGSAQTGSAPSGTVPAAGGHGPSGTSALTWWAVGGGLVVLAILLGGLALQRRGARWRRGAARARR